MTLSKKKYTILAVDDEANNLNILERILKPKYNIISLDSSEKALETIFSGIPIDLILLDIMMPNINGFEMAQKIKANKATREIPLIFLTGQMDPRDIQKGFECGGQDYITKPYHILELRARVDTHLKIQSQQQQLSEMNQVLEKKVAQRTRDLQKLLEQKETLILELTHRVKNMLQMSISLMQLRLINIRHEETKEAVEDFLCSMQIISLAHTLTQNETDLLEIPAKNFLHQLTPIMIKRFSKQGFMPRIRLNSEEIGLHFNTIIPMGLLIIDVLCLILRISKAASVTQDMEIRFAADKKNRIRLDMEFKSNKAMLEILSQNEQELKLAQLLTQQLHGTLNFSASKSCYTLCFEEPDLRTYNPYVEKPGKRKIKTPAA
ncbi:response regulator [bacterium]|nr:response regulator [bacterium]